MKTLAIYLHIIFCLILPINIYAQAWTAAELIEQYSLKPDTSSYSSLSVGGTTINDDVTSTGAYTFNLPIEVPIGINGMQPNVSLAYSSQNGEGFAGWSCSISGLTAITRGIKNIYHDGAAEGITFTDKDALYLNGQRLIQKKGFGIVDGATFVLENEPYRIFQVHENGISQWISEKQTNGITIVYGRDLENQQLITTQQGFSFINAWYQCYIEDKNGNALAITYEKDQNTLYPSKILYGRNTNKNNEYICSVNFDYETKEFPSKYIINGIRCGYNKRLKNIETKCDNTLFRKYILNYNKERTTQKEYLISIDTYSSNLDEKRTVLLEWSKASDEGINHSTIEIPETDYYLTEKRDRLFTGVDINGDGISDLLEFAPVTITTANGAGTKSGYLENYLIPYLSSISGNGEIKYDRKDFIKLGADINFGDFIDGMGAPTFSDMNGDGIQDVVIPDLQVIKNTGIRRVYFKILYGKKGDCINRDMDILGVQLTSTSQFPLYTAADLDADGKGEIVILEKDHDKSGYFSLKVMPSAERGNISDISASKVKLNSTPLKLFAGDFTNDGLIDLLVIEKNCAQIIKNKGGKKPYELNDLELITDENVKDANLIEVGDFNGDGVLDFVMFKGKEITIAIGNGKGLYTLCTPQVFDNLDNYNFKSEEARILAYDFDHDNKTDIVIEKANNSHRNNFIDTRTFWLKSDGTSFTLVSSAISTKRDDAKGQRYVLGDFDGDGYTDMMNYGNQCLNATNSKDEPKFHLYSNFSSPSEQKVIHLDNGFDVDHYITYESPILNNIYKVEQEATYPIVDCIPNIPLATMLTINNGVIGFTERKFNYDGLKTNLQGKGVLGFTKFTITDTSDKSTTEVQVTGYDNSCFLPISTKTTKTIGNYKSTVESINKIENIIGKAFFCYTQKSIDTDFSGNIKITENTYDINKGCLKEKKETYDDSSYIKTTINEFTSIKGLWMPSYTTITKKHPDDNAEFTDITKIGYDDKGNIIKSTSHIGTDKEITNLIAYDNYGNAISSTFVADDLPKFSSCSEYSTDGRFTIRTYTSPATKEELYTFDKYGNLIEENEYNKSSLPITTKYEYDSWGAEIANIQTTGEITGTLKKWNSSTDKSFFIVTYGSGKPWTKTLYDRCGRELRMETVYTGNLLETTTTEYTNEGNISKNKRILGKLTTSTQMTYDELGRLLTKTLSTGKETKYLYDKNKVTIEENGRTCSKEYDSWGNVKKSVDPISMVEYEYYSNGKIKNALCEGNCVSFEYDAAGNRTSLKDPNIGTISSEYDVLGRLIKQIDGRGVVTNKEYNAIGQLNSESGATDKISYTYNNMGLVKVINYGNNSESRQYDKSGRLTYILRYPEFSDTQIYGYKYNSIGEIIEETLPGGIKVNYTYDTYGNCISKSVDTKCVWKLISDDGITRKESVLDDKLIIQTERDKNCNLSKCYLQFAGKDIDGLYYQFDSKTGNLMRKSRMGDKDEIKFKYDNLDRLISESPVSSIENPDIIVKPHINTQISGINNPINPGNKPTWLWENSFRYANNGNITETSSQGKYTYSENLPNAVETTTGLSKITDKQDITYNDLNLPDGIMQGEGNDKLDLEYYYGTDNSRWHAEYYKDNNLYRTIDYGSDYERTIENDTIREFWYLDKNIMLYRENGGQLHSLYMLTDNVGSIVGIYDSEGKELFRASYNPWGIMTTKKNDIALIRGYTGHEMLPEFQLINTNGRLYDPSICRFLSPDEYIQDPYNSQSYNRYSYCYNNPLKFSDPNGEYALIDDIAAIGIGGTINLVVNIVSGNIHGSVWVCIGKGTAAFAAGAIAGEASLYPQYGGWAWGGAIVGATNSWLAGSKGWDIAKGAAIGAMASGIGSYASNYFSTLGTINIASVELRNPIINYMVRGALVGSASGFTTDFTIALICGKSLEQAFNASLEGALMGAVSGSINGVANGIRTSYENKVSKWTGEKTNDHHPNPKFLGGSKNQKLTRMTITRHRRLHRVLNKHLFNITDGKGHHMRPQRGNNGKEIIKNFEYDIRINTMKEFYDSHPFEFWDVRFDFYRENNMLNKWRPW